MPYTRTAQSRIHQCSIHTYTHKARNIPDTFIGTVVVYIDVCILAGITRIAPRGASSVRGFCIFHRMGCGVSKTGDVKIPKTPIAARYLVQDEMNQGTFATCYHARYVREKESVHARESECLSKRKRECGCSRATHAHIHSHTYTRTHALVHRYMHA